MDTYFAMARGYQESSGDVKALAMKKWFNTNYHYIVPEVEDDTVISLTGDKLWKEYEEALALGIETKPIVTGAYTMLKLCRYTGAKTAEDYVDAFIDAYKALVNRCEEKQIAWLQFDEPALVRICQMRTWLYFIRFMTQYFPVQRSARSCVRHILEM